MLCLLSVATLLVPVGLAVSFGAEDRSTLKADSRARYVHRITLYDENGVAIDPSDPLALPYSPENTCGKCHPVGQVHGGWHFNAMDAEIPPGRPGEPWIWTDPLTGTQLPLSYRRWPGVHHPDDIGLTVWQFVQKFGHHLPGYKTDHEIVDQVGKVDSRWPVAGKFQVDCMICHSADNAHDMNERARKLEDQNYSWAPTAALGLGVVRGAVKRLPEDFDPLEPPNPDYPDRVLPMIDYDETRFDANDRVFLDITRHMSADRCYFCHTTRMVGPDALPSWHSDEDVHLAAGMSCTDCHRNGIDHNIVRGYAVKTTEADQSAVGTLSCAGCHLDDNFGADSDSLAGRLGAPLAVHVGLPPLHFELMTCTACHSGPWPRKASQTLQTAMAHQLGLATKKRTMQDAPQIVAPVFVRQSDGKIAPHKLIWPAFWAIEHAGQFEPILPEEIKSVVTGKRAFEPISGKMLTESLRRIGNKYQRPGGVVYIADSRVHRLNDAGQLISEVHDAANPYTWPIAHDVRPVAQSLGVHGCTECHSSDSPFVFGNVSSDPMTSVAPAPMKPMHEFELINPAIAASWAMAFQFHVVFKVVGIILTAIIVLGLLRYVMFHSIRGSKGR